jgi:Arc/MetJ-type ribon-helix-helix transcriptional regulator
MARTRITLRVDRDVLAEIEAAVDDGQHAHRSAAVRAALRDRFGGQ